MNIKDKKILLLSVFSSAIVSSLVTYYATKTNYQEQYYSQMLEEKSQEKIQQDKLNQNFKFTIGNEKAY
ncbi:MAG: hypothetical protein RLZZ210_644 [Pseudomonadota bacterium]|jgi:hypothetical protein